MAGKTKYTNEQIIAALKSTKGFVSFAAKKLGCNPGTIHRRAAKCRSVRRALRNERDLQLDFAETKLLAAIDAGEAWAICFFLKCQGKDRGYVERAEVTGRDGGPLAVKEVKLTDEQRRDALLRIWNAGTVGASAGGAVPDGQSPADGFLVVGSGTGDDGSGHDAGPVAEEGVA
jgi:hypothetical protein